MLRSACKANPSLRQMSQVGTLGERKFSGGSFFVPDYGPDRPSHRRAGDRCDVGAVFGDGVDFEGLEDVLKVLRGDFDPCAALPETGQKTTSIDKCHGRAGDMVVVQLRGISGTTLKEKATLRSLGLRRMGSMSLRWRTPINLGYVRAVRHLIGVVFLDEPIYKQGIDYTYETTEYGTNSRPGETWRSINGEYMGYQYEPSTLAVYMSTRATFADILLRLQNCGFEVDIASTEAVLSTPRSASGGGLREGRFPQLMDGVDVDLVQRAVFPCRSIGRVSEQTIFLTVLWQAPFARFYDMDRECAEVSVVTDISNVGTIHNVKAHFAEPTVKSDCRLSVHYNERGRRREAHL